MYNYSIFVSGISYYIILLFVCLWLFAWADCTNEIFFIFMRIAHNPHSYTYFIYVRELLYILCILLIFWIYFILFCMPAVPGVTSLAHPCEYITPPPLLPPQRLLSSFNPLLPRPFTSSRPGISSRSQIAADIAGHMDGQRSSNSLISSSLNQNIQ